MRRQFTSPRPSSPPMGAAPTGFFVVKITDDSAAPEYQWGEVWDDGTGALVEKVGGEYGSAGNPGVDVLGSGFAVDDYAFCRSADGNAGLTWELFAIGGAGTTITATETLKTATYTFASSNAWEDTSGSLGTFSLPAAGTYLVTFRVRFNFQVAPTVSSYILPVYARLYDTTAAAIIDGTVIGFTQEVDLGVTGNLTCEGTKLITVSGATTIRLEVFRGPTSGTNSFLTFVKVDSAVALGDNNSVVFNAVKMS